MLKKGFAFVSYRNTILFAVYPACPNLSFKKDVDLVFVDFAKAFDTVNHRFLLAKLKSPGIDGPFQSAPKVHSLARYFFCFI